MVKAPLPTVALTTEKIKNTTSGIDVCATDFWFEKSEKMGGLLGKSRTVYYQLLVATDRAKLLGCRNASASGRNDDVHDGVAVHFTLGKSYGEIVQLRNDLDTTFSGTFFPALPKSIGGGSSLLDSRKNARGTTTEIDRFFTVCCSSLKVAFARIFLEFFGFKLTGDVPLQPSAKDREGKSGGVSSGRTAKSFAVVEDLFAEEDDSGSKLDLNESLFDVDGSATAAGSSGGSLRSRRKDGELFAAEEEAKEELFEVGSDEEVDLSDLMSQLKAVPKVGGKADKKAAASAAEGEEEREKYEIDFEAIENLDEENILDYITTNFDVDDALTDVTFDFS